MAGRKNVIVNHEDLYSQKLRQIQKIFAEGISDMITNHINFFIEKYGNWEKYPRKVKKKLKKTFLWNLRYHDKIEEGTIKVKMTYEF